MQPPAFDKTDKLYTVNLPPDVLTFVHRVLKSRRKNNTFTVKQLYWIANQSPKKLDKHVVVIYHALKEIGLRAAIPQDN